MFMVQIRPELRALLNSSWRCLGRAKSEQTPWHFGRRFFLDRKTTFSKQAQTDLLTLISSLWSRRGYACAPTTVEPDGTRNPRLFIMNDSAGRSSVEGDTSFRGGGVWLFKDNAEYTPWSNTQWTDGQLDKHSTETEIANANCSLASLIKDHTGYDIIEVLDNQAAVQTLRTLGCRSVSLEDQLMYRLEILEQAPHDTRVFTVWSCREHGTLADMLSKNEMEAFRIAVEERGLPPPCSEPFTRTTPRL